MKTAPRWQYNEMKVSGVDFSKPEQVAAYDSMHKKFRDYAKETDEIIRRLGLGSERDLMNAVTAQGTRRKAQGMGESQI